MSVNVRVTFLNVRIIKRSGSLYFGLGINGFPGCVGSVVKRVKGEWIERMDGCVRSSDRQTLRTDVTDSRQ